MSYIELYKKRVGSNNITNSKTRLIYEARKNFERRKLTTNGNFE